LTSAWAARNISNLCRLAATTDAIVPDVREQKERFIVGFKVVVHYPNGSREEEDEVFATKTEANDYGLQLLDNYRVGGETLHMSNMGDYPLSDEAPEFEVIEVNG
jgi:hypothetical protein